MRTFYKINTNGTASIGSGTVIPDGFTEDFSKLTTKKDGSYYTFYNPDGTPDLIAEQTQTNAIRKEEILKRFVEIEKLSARPMIAISLGIATTFDTNKLKVLNDEAVALRAEIATLV